jgi:hypothetical protein
MPLSYLDFDYSEDEQGWGNFDAMASVLPPQRPALQAELAQVLNWAHATSRSSKLRWTTGASGTMTCKSGRTTPPPGHPGTPSPCHSAAHRSFATPSSSSLTWTKVTGALPTARPAYLPA